VGRTRKHLGVMDEGESDIVRVETCVDLLKRANTYEDPVARLESAK
jgi:hypothetical protein